MGATRSRDDRPPLRESSLTCREIHNRFCGAELDYAQHEINGCSLLSGDDDRVDAADSADAPGCPLLHPGTRTLNRMRAVDEGTTPGPLQRQVGRAADWFESDCRTCWKSHRAGARIRPNLRALTRGRPQTVGVRHLLGRRGGAVVRRYERRWPADSARRVIDLRALQP